MKLLRQRGQTLIEVLASFLIIAGSAIALIQFQTHLIYTNSVTQQQNTAFAIAMNQVETLRNFSMLTGSGSYATIASGTSTTNGTSTTYTASWTITANVNPDYKTVNITVSWTDRRGNNQSVNLVSLIGGIEPAYSAAVMG